MEPNEMVAGLLREARFTNVFTKPVSAAVCREPIVVANGSWSAEGDAGCEAFGTYACVVRVARIDSHEAADVAFACEEALVRADWEREREDAPLRVRDVECGMPELVGCDASGVTVWAFEARVSVAHPHDRGWGCI